jgi:hypothetical protein
MSNHRTYFIQENGMRAQWNAVSNAKTRAALIITRALEYQKVLRGGTGRNTLPQLLQMAISFDETVLPGLGGMTFVMAKKENKISFYFGMKKDGRPWEHIRFAVACGSANAGEGRHTTKGNQPPFVFPDGTHLKSSDLDKLGVRQALIGQQEGFLTRLEAACLEEQLQSRHMDARFGDRRLYRCLAMGRKDKDLGPALTFVFITYFPNSIIEKQVAAGFLRINGTSGPVLAPFNHLNLQLPAYSGSTDTALPPMSARKLVDVLNTQPVEIFQLFGESVLGSTLALASRCLSAPQLGAVLYGGTPRDLVRGELPNDLDLRFSDENCDLVEKLAQVSQLGLSIGLPTVATFKVGPSVLEMLLVSKRGDGILRVQLVDGKGFGRPDFDINALQLQHVDNSITLGLILPAELNLPDVLGNITMGVMVRTNHDPNAKVFCSLLFFNDDVMSL